MLLARAARLRPSILPGVRNCSTDPTKQAEKSYARAFPIGYTGSIPDTESYHRNITMKQKLYSVCAQVYVKFFGTFYTGVMLRFSLIVDFYFISRKTAATYLSGRNLGATGWAG